MLGRLLALGKEGFRGWDSFGHSQGTGLIPIGERVSPTWHIAASVAVACPLGPMWASNCYCDLHGVCRYVITGIPLKVSDVEVFGNGLTSSNGSFGPWQVQHVELTNSYRFTCFSVSLHDAQRLHCMFS